MNLSPLSAFYTMMPLVMTEPKLPVEAAKAGDQHAWDQLFRRFQMPLFVYAAELLGDREESFDVVQETFIRALKHIGSLRDETRFGSWLFGIAHQLCIARWRRGRRQEWLEIDESLPADELDPAEFLLDSEQQELLRTALGELSPPHRAVLLLYFLEDFSLEEIAEVLETNLGTVKSRLFYAKRALRQILEEK